MIANCAATIGIENTKILIAFASIVLATIFLLALKKTCLSTKSKIFLIYSHIISLLFPFVLLTTNAGCGMVCSPCYTNVTQLVGLSIPTTFLIGTAAGFALMPALFIRSYRKTEIKSGKVFDFVKQASRKMGISQPNIYTVQGQAPAAFSFRKFKSAVFLSVGLFDILQWKEIQAVILHELAHIKEASSALKISALLLNIFSPMSILILRFHHTNKEEELKADGTAANIQGTEKHIISARKKILAYGKYKG